MIVSQRIIVAGLFLGVAFLSGFRLTRSGKPYSGIVLTIHKLLSLAAVILLGMAIRQINQASALSAAESTASAVTGLSFVGTIVTGGLASIDKPMPAATVMHRAMPFVTLLSAGVALYLLWGRI